MRKIGAVAGRLHEQINLRLLLSFMIDLTNKRERKKADSRVIADRCRSSLADLIDRPIDGNFHSPVLKAGLGWHDPPRAAFADPFVNFRLAIQCQLADFFHHYRHSYHEIGAVARRTNVVRCDDVLNHANQLGQIASFRAFTSVQPPDERAVAEKVEKILIFDRSVQILSIMPRGSDQTGQLGVHCKESGMRR